MAKKTKKQREALEKYSRTELYPLEEAVEIVKKIAYAKFDETLECHIKLGIDPRKSDQTVRGTTVLPHGTGKTPRVIVFTKGDKIKAAEEAGADAVGAEDLVARVKEGWSDFDICVASPDMMGEVGKQLGRVLGPRMPNPRAGTVTPDPAKAVAELKSGKIQYRADKLGIVHAAVGKVSFDTQKLLENMNVLLDALVKARPSTSKGTYLRSIHLTPTMGPAVKVDPTKATLSAVQR
ncbi:MAG: 50S ribosomal protein L1 [Armatimonadetes bacterium]|nr:50S ribosomal protein L1 [Armatimonadota bacterium]